MNDRREFEKLIFGHLLPQFRDDPLRSLKPELFKNNLSLVSDVDASNFVRAWNAGLLHHAGRGLYETPRGHARELFFWAGKREETGQAYWLWLEPIITVGTMAVLHADFGWPKDLIGSQSADWAFDVVTHLDTGRPDEYVACEVKKTNRELNHLVDLMTRFGDESLTAEDGLSQTGINALRKLTALRKRRAPVFWAVGPGGTSRAFRVEYPPGAQVFFEETDLTALDFPHRANPHRK